LISGSNASLLSKELGTKLTGRHLDFTLFPFSYGEFLDFRKAKNTTDDLTLEYLLNGGFPEFLRNNNKEILIRLLDDIVYRDVAVRYGIRNHKTLKQLLLYLITNVAKLFSYNQLKKLFSTGSVNTIIDYISFFQDAYLLFAIPKFSFSLKEQIYNPQKIYCVDNGLISTVSLSFSGDLGRKLENLVFLNLKQRHDQVYYFYNDSECDFIYRNRNNKLEACQVCYELTPENQDREIKGLLDALHTLNLKKGSIITFNQKDKLSWEGKFIELIPLAEFLAIKNTE
jgi:predicted AAA+ superfamily ATPase